MLRTLLFIAATILVAACTANSGADGSVSPAASASSEAPAGGSDAGGGAQLPESIIEPIVVDAAGRLGVDPSEVTIVDAHPETWPDGSLGCPEPGMMYTQALVEGYQVIVQANGTQLDYRGGGQGGFRLCENP
jgi:hypothetical protein